MYRQTLLCCYVRFVDTQIKTILLTKQGEDEDQYRESVLYGWV